MSNVRTLKFGDRTVSYDANGLASLPPVAFSGGTGSNSNTQGKTTKY